MIEARQLTGQGRQGAGSTKRAIGPDMARGLRRSRTSRR
jgi:hypothetical protein